tara:strand:+ start:481 stop:1860 length:1380 start_codon:yes stop_codon:yes gene_type:complete
MEQIAEPISDTNSNINYSISEGHTVDANGDNLGGENETEIEKGFEEIITEFLDQLNVTFPEYSETILKLKNQVNEASDIHETEVYKHCKKVFPIHFYEILYKKADLFKNNVFLLPEINFADIWSCNISDTTRDSIWNFLNYISFYIIKTIGNGDIFKETLNAISGIDNDDIKNQINSIVSTLEDTFGNLGNMDGGEGGVVDEGGSTDEGSGGEGSNDLGNDIFSKLSGLMDGKIGKIAKDIAEETSSSFMKDFEDLNIDETTEVPQALNQIFSKLKSNPSTIMNMMQSLGTKLNTKIKEENLTKEDLIGETGDLMKNLEGLNDFSDIFKNMPGMAGMGGMGDLLKKASQPNVQNRMNQQLNASKKRETMKEALNRRKLERQAKATLYNIQRNVSMQNEIQNNELINGVDLDKELDALVNFIDPTNQGVNAGATKVDNNQVKKKKKKRKKKNKGQKTNNV